MGKNRRLFALITLCMLFMIAAGCGGKSQENVVKKIEEKLKDMNGYKVEAEMTMKTGQEERSYDINVWFKKGQEDFYRVGLENEEEEGGQVILKNDEGVFVLTPALNKSFKFQTDWPESSSQPYLYQSLVNDVITDKEAKFTDSESHYIFLTKTNYQNNTNLPYQEVYFDKKTFAPTAVKIMDKDNNTLVEVTFNSFDVNPAFQNNDFNRESILKDTLADTSAVTNMEQQEDLAVMFPLNTLGSELIEKQEVSLEDGERVIMTFKGDRNFTLIQEKTTVVPTSAESTLEEVSGEVVNLGYSIGAVSNNTLEWNYNGTDFYLASEDMTIEELIEVASSIQGQEIK
ncbi:outer membrane lipoprotein carrier protein LolA [Pseudogracilibacillus auburnensis]|uniref:Outer membrane lipoprotein-sorting protein n=1 Tax=Pseudogracilibacillus auburnensis TaxID=1494959 RepID=A0A2V3VHJ9_9BACI|nr:outer membrane lipoprotein carrier protein LolA [Pseudogracilibacillus auburnensis]PXW80361.1 outer membrane lipoprotein-sorting protein [Pseudogracilibacillus auburnensis]